MSRGKYAIKAVNRAASIDNNVIAEQRARIETLEAENKHLIDSLSVAAADTRASIAQQAAEKAAEYLKIAEAQHLKAITVLQDEHRKEKRQIGTRIYRILRRTTGGKWLPTDLWAELVNLVGEQAVRLADEYELLSNSNSEAATRIRAIQQFESMLPIKASFGE